MTCNSPCEFDYITGSKPMDDSLMHKSLVPGLSDLVGAHQNSDRS